MNALQKKFERAVQENDIPLVKSLITNNQVDPTADYNYFFIDAAKDGKLEIVKAFLEEGRVNPSANHNSALAWAAWNGHKEIVNILLVDGRVDSSYFTDLIDSVMKGNKLDQEVYNNYYLKLHWFYRVEQTKAALQESIDFDKKNERKKAINNGGEL